MLPLLSRLVGPLALPDLREQKMPTCYGTLATLHSLKRYWTARIGLRPHAGRVGSARDGGSLWSDRFSDYRSGRTSRIGY
jgi:hypothetical protein